MHCKTIKIDMVYLSFAYQDESPDNTYYLDTEYGDICLVNRELLDLKDLTDEIELSRDKFLYIPKPNGKDLIEDLRNFVETVQDAKLKGVLSVAFESPYVMQAFRTILNPHSEELSRFEKFIAKRTRERVIGWLNANGLAPE
jgi:Uncharacterised protein family (UPF0158)